MCYRLGLTDAFGTVSHQSDVILLHQNVVFQIELCLTFKMSRQEEEHGKEPDFPSSPSGSASNLAHDGNHSPRSPENPYARFNGLGTWDPNDSRSKQKQWKYYLQNSQVPNSTQVPSSTQALSSTQAPSPTQAPNSTEAHEVTEASVSTNTKATRKPRARQVKSTVPRKPRAAARTTKKRAWDDFMSDEPKETAIKQPRIKGCQGVKDTNPKKSKPNTKQKKAEKPEDEVIDSSAPPLHNFKEIFAHMTESALSQDTELALGSLHSHRLRIGTMCSGTEAPLLVLQEICECKFDTDIMPRVITNSLP